MAPPKTARVGFILLVGLLCLAAAAKAIVADTLDPDCFWHLRVGEELSHQSWPHPLVDDLSFASLKRPWTPYSWLAELGMKKLWDAGGYRAAVAVQAAMEAGFLMMLALAAVEASRGITGQPRYLAAIGATVVGAILSLAYLSFRPVTFALLLLAIIAWLLLRDRRMQQKSKAVWCVPFITLLLANIHFYSILVPLWTGALFVGDSIDTWRQWKLRRVRHGFILMVTSLIASVTTPMLPGTFKSVVDYGLNDVLVHSSVITEMTPFYKGGVGHVAAALVCFIFIAVTLRFFKETRLGFGEVIWLCGSGLMLLMVGRMAPVFAIAGVPLFAATMPNLSDRILTKPALMIALAFFVVVGSWKLAGAFPAKNQPISVWLNRHGKGFPAYPCGAVDFVEQNIPPVSGRIINDFPWGGYLEWRLGGKFQVLLDGRTQLFDHDFMQSLFFGTREDRQRVVVNSHADLAIIPVDGGMFRQTLGDLNWRSVYQDQFAEVFVPPNN